MRRTRYLVCYDIANPKRLRRVAKVLESYGRRLQFSVFECPLGALRFSKLRADLQGVLNHDQDQVMFVSLGGAEADASLIIETMGLPYVTRTRITVV